MGTFSIWHLLIILIVVVLLFGAGRVSDLGKGLGEGIRNFKKGLGGDEEQAGSRGRSKVADAEPAKVEAAPAPKQLVDGPKKKVIQLEVDDDVDEEELARLLAKKKASKDEKAS
jgi:sec-independent protein translocase protein TatA